VRRGWPYTEKQSGLFLVSQKLNKLKALLKKLYFNTSTKTRFYNNVVSIQVQYNLPRHISEESG